jgi:hypothetical protein
MDQAMKQLLKAAAGLAIVLAWWTLRGPGEDTTETAEKIPSVVWDGGAGSMTIRAETTTPARMRVHFSEEVEGAEPARSLETWEDVAAGSHSWTIAVPANVSGYLELGATDPKPGDRLRWSIEAGSATVDEQDETLQQALEENHAFFLQTCFDDLASGTLGEC